MRSSIRETSTLLSSGKGRQDRIWITPPETYARLNEEFAFDFDPCPHPRPDGFDGLTEPWGSVNYVNLLSQVIPWVTKAIEEVAKGKTVVMVYPSREIFLKS